MGARRHHPSRGRQMHSSVSSLLASASRETLQRTRLTQWSLSKPAATFKGHPQACL